MTNVLKNRHIEGKIKITDAMAKCRCSSLLYVLKYASWLKEFFLKSLPLDKSTQLQRNNYIINAIYEHDQY